MIITSTASIEGRKIEKYLGVVTGDSAFVPPIKGLFKHDASVAMPEMKKTRDEATLSMIADAKGIGADALIGFTLVYGTYQGYSSQGPTSMLIMITAYGTAVKLGN